MLSLVFSISTYYLLLFKPIYGLTWTSGSPNLPNLFRGAAVGSYGGKIYLIGSWNAPRQLIEYDIATNSFQITPAALSRDVRGTAQPSTQIRDMVYYYSRDRSQIERFNLQTKQTELVTNGRPPTVSGKQSCITSDSNGIIYVTDFSGNFQIYDTNTDTWTVGASLIQSRANQGCAVHEATQQLYVFGGYNGGNLNSIETISTNNVQSNTWTTIPNTLVDTCRHLHAETFKNDIIIVGGRCSGANHHVQIIDVSNDNVYRDSGILNSGTDQSGVIIVGDRLYSFGGWDETQTADTDIWEYTDLSAIDICDTNYLDRGCAGNQDCPACMQCCEFNKVCEYPPAAESVLNSINEMDEKMHGVFETKVVDKYPMYNIILFVGFILFVLINNVFIGYWCVCKKNNGPQNNKYESDASVNDV